MQHSKKIKAIKDNLREHLNTINIVERSLVEKISDGFSKLTPSVACLLFMCICMFSLSKAMSVIPVGFTYATYGGLTITAIAVFGLIKYNQMPNMYGIIGIALIVIGVILLNTFGKTT